MTSITFNTGTSTGSTENTNNSNNRFVAPELVTTTATETERTTTTIPEVVVGTNNSTGNNTNINNDNHSTSQRRSIEENPIIRNIQNGIKYQQVSTIASWITVLFDCLAIVILYIATIVCFSMSTKPISTTTTTSSSDDPISLLINNIENDNKYMKGLVCRIVGGIVFGQSLSCTILILPFIYDLYYSTQTIVPIIPICSSSSRKTKQQQQSSLVVVLSGISFIQKSSIQTIRASAISSSITGLVVFVTCLIEYYYYFYTLQQYQQYQQELYDESLIVSNINIRATSIVNNDTYSSSYFMCLVGIGIGTSLLITSSISLMASFWPLIDTISATTTNNNDSEIIQYIRKCILTKQQTIQQQQQQQQQLSSQQQQRIHHVQQLQLDPFDNNNNNNNLHVPLLSQSQQRYEPNSSNNGGGDLEEALVRVGQEQEQQQHVVVETIDAETNTSTNNSNLDGFSTPELISENGDSDNDVDEIVAALQAIEEAEAAVQEVQQSLHSNNTTYTSNVTTGSCINHSNQEQSNNLENNTSSSNMNHNNNSNDPTNRTSSDSYPEEEADVDTNTANNSPSRLRGTRRLLQLVRSEVVYLYIGCIVLLIRLPFSLAIPHFVSTTISALTQNDYTTARIEVYCLLLLGTIDSILDFWCVFLFGYANTRIVRGLKIDLYSTLVRQEVSFYDTTNSGELISRINSDCNEMANDLTWFFRFSIESTVRIIGIASYMIIRCPILGCCTLVVIPIVAIINKVYGNWLHTNSIAVQNAIAAVNTISQETLCNIRTIISFATEDYECYRYTNTINKHFYLNVRQLYITGVYYMIVCTFLINTIVQGCLLLLGTYLIEHKVLTADVMLAFMLYQSQLQNETMNLFNAYSSLIKSSGAGDKVFTLLDRKPSLPAIAALQQQQQQQQPPTESDNGMRRKKKERHGLMEPLLDDSTVSPYHTTSDLTMYQNYPSLMEGPIDRNITGNHIELRGVTFSYPTRPDSTILNSIDISIPYGKTLALVGASGCGKTTIINLLQRFYDPTSGSIYIDGIDLKDLDLQEHRRSIGIVTQDPVLFHGTIEENIRYGCRNDTIVNHTGTANSIDEDNVVVDSDVVRAATLAHADGFITNFPDKYQTNVGERGLQLSGGQKQRIAIARAIYQKRQLLLLDEATSALDTESEIAVQRALDELLFLDSNNSNSNRRMTTIIIAHRLRTVQNADEIIVLKNGIVAERGTHNELMMQHIDVLRGIDDDDNNTRGIYRKMVERASPSGILDES